MESDSWVWGSSGLYGPQYLVDLAELKLESSLAEAEAGVPSEDQSEPLIAALLLAGLVRWFRPAPQEDWGPPSWVRM